MPRNPDKNFATEVAFDDEMWNYLGQNKEHQEKSSPQPQTEPEKKPKTQAEKILGVIASARRSHSDQEPNLTKQQEVIEALPPLAQYMRQHLAHALEIQREYRGPKYTFSKDEMRAIIAGEVGELLARAEYGKNRTQLETEFAQVWQDPEQYGLGLDLTRVKNPDLVYVEIKEDETIVVHAAGEVKTGLLDPRAKKQLEGDKFRSNAESLLTSLKEIAHDIPNTIVNIGNQNMLHMLGFTDLADNIDRIEIVSQDAFQIHLILPENRNVPDENKGLSEEEIYQQYLALINIGKFNDEYFGDVEKAQQEVREFVQLLRNHKAITIQRLSFTSGEISKIVKMIEKDLDI